MARWEGARCHEALLPKAPRNGASWACAGLHASLAAFRKPYHSRARYVMTLWCNRRGTRVNLSMRGGGTGLSALRSERAYIAKLSSRRVPILPEAVPCKHTVSAFLSLNSRHQLCAWAERTIL
eukprot:scaffold324979_cov134-Tisochrysis_lutea.AAC.2